MQRNRALDRLRPENTFVVFYDDDFIPSRFALAGIERFFKGHPEVAGAHGLVLADGINGPGIALGDAQQLVDAADTEGEPTSVRILSRTHGLYGCNMAYRVSMIQGVRFDERLPFIRGWRTWIWWTLPARWCTRTHSGGALRGKAGP
ncbi:MAG: hypothetical protein R3E56_08515 [Burkholderiaceae bacterium]